MFRENGSGGGASALAIKGLKLSGRSAALANGKASLARRGELFAFRNAFALC